MQLISAMARRVDIALHGRDAEIPCIKEAFELLAIVDQALGLHYASAIEQDGIGQAIDAERHAEV